MANRYWIGGSGNWGDTAKWSTSSGGSGGASVPTSSDDVYFDGSSNVGTDAFTVTLNTSARSCGSFTVSGLDGAMTLAGSQSLSVAGSTFTLPATNFSCTMTGQLTFNGSGTTTANFNGNVFGTGQVAFDANVTLASAFTSTFQCSIQSDTLNLAGYTFTCRNLVALTAGAKTITYGVGGSIVLTGSNLTVFDFSAGTLSFSDPGNGGIVLTSTTTSQRTLALGAGLALGSLTIGGATGTSTLTIQGSNTFTRIESTKTVAHTITFTDGTTQTVGVWTVKGTSGNVVTLQGSSTAGWTLDCPSLQFGEGNYLSISRSTATPAGTWYAGDNSTDGGNNSGWTFRSQPSMQFLPFF
jgi:hypothetical protein